MPGTPGAMVSYSRHMLSFNHDPFTFVFVWNSAAPVALGCCKMYKSEVYGHIKQSHGVDAVYSKDPNQV